MFANEYCHLAIELCCFNALFLFTFFLKRYFLNLNCTCTVSLFLDLVEKTISLGGWDMGVSDAIFLLNCTKQGLTYIFIIIIINFFLGGWVLFLCLVASQSVYMVA